KHDMVVAGEYVVGRIKADPSGLLPAPGEYPRVHGIGPLKLRLVGQPSRPQIAADIGGRASERAHAGGDHMRTLLTRAARQRERHRGSCGRWRGPELVDEFRFDAV